MIVCVCVVRAARCACAGGGSSIFSTPPPHTTKNTTQHQPLLRGRVRARVGDRRLRPDARPPRRVPGRVQDRDRHDHRCGRCLYVCVVVMMSVSALRRASAAARRDPHSLPSHHLPPFPQHKQKKTPARVCTQVCVRALGQIRTHRSDTHHQPNAHFPKHEQHNKNHNSQRVQQQALVLRRRSPHGSLLCLFVCCVAARCVCGGGSAAAALVLALQLNPPLNPSPNNTQKRRQTKQPRT